MTPEAGDPPVRTIHPPGQRRNGMLCPPRARAACTLCRARKIRCDAKGSQPCTNCVFEDVQCILLPRQRRAKTQNSHTRRQTALPPGGSSNALALSAVHGADIGPNHKQSRQHPPPDSSTDHTPPNSDPVMVQQTSVSLENKSTQDSEDDIDWYEAAVNSVPPQYSPNSSASSTFDRTWPTSGPSSTDSPVAPFVKLAPSHMSRADVNYLHEKGACSLPDAELRDALIESYIDYIHPCYPFLDLELLDKALCGNSNQQFSLPVLQAIMFAASSWVDIKLLRRRGFLTRKAARMTFYLRTRVSVAPVCQTNCQLTPSELLYDLDYEKDPMCNIQTLILLSLWFEGPPQYKDGWHWLGIALSLARSIGLHQDINNQYLTPKARALRRRLWWSCTIRDTCASIATNRVPRIRDSDFRVAPLTFDDFEMNIQSRPDHHNMRAKSLYLQRQQVSICIHTASICRIITRVLLNAFHETPTGNIDILYFHSIPKQRGPHIEPRELRGIEDQFRRWLEGAPSEVLHAGPLPSRLDTHEKALFVHRALLSILYHTGFVLIHRQRTLASDGHEPDERSTATHDEGTPRAIIREAAMQVNKIIMDAYAADVMKEMPPTVISCLFPISLSHLTDMRSEDPVVRCEGRQRLEECRQAIRELMDGHMAAEWAINFLNHVESRLHSALDPTKRGSAVGCGKAPSNGPEKRSPAGYDQRQRWEQQIGAQSTGGDSAIHLSAGERPKSTDLGSTTLDEQLTTEHNPFLYTHTPAGFSDLIFPDTWLGGPDAQNNASSGAWVDSDIMSMPFA
ncbi:uncharacterized protein Z520_05139 [Fonsecaea multimorphosa CBS 102226]|uniref:Zn(2)-C6 fungal-type domain-containing protein n=1 Tax=Fonsecaea multimorphosa CBS 102226 TaxID=1442371 RepID=A0A0D2KS85_9EURO|nr:uncharacterized protein Z520_05139 [Fonsecaea multimorphosa CBS 102226]KIX99563.1 hypothetical protein Z520_05139 [Fonsecaea multimorphosa CBS 102226]OAL25554.1 hypothetical protein AYO22_04873 [Fonsecaea multimorphosa]